MRPFRVKHEGKEYLFSDRPTREDIKEHIGCDYKSVELEELSYEAMQKYGFIKTNIGLSVADILDDGDDYVFADFSNPNMEDCIPFGTGAHMPREQFWMIQMMKIAKYCNLKVVFYGDNQKGVDWCEEYMNLG